MKSIHCKILCIVKYFYSATELTKTVPIPATEKWAAETIYPYEAESDLIKAVNLAILLERPLLLMGEPGGGKTKLAQALAYEMHHHPKEGIHYRDWYFEWFIKSTSKARDGLYEYDAIGRLRDAQLKSEKVSNKEKYITYGPLGQAILQSKDQQDRRPVILIDEIDKANLDFPNDLLLEIDQSTFVIPELETTIRAGKVKPIFIITSNRENELPDAFLRRCIYHFIQPLGDTTLKNIIRRRFFNDEMTNEKESDLINKAVKQFIDLRTAIRHSKTAGKNVSTSELLDWFEALKKYSEALDNDIKAPYLESVREEIEKFRRGEGGLPLYNALFKNWETLADFKRNESEYLSITKKGE